MYNSTFPSNNSFIISCTSSPNNTSIEEALKFYGCVLAPYAVYLNATTITNFATKIASPLWNISPLVQNILSLVGLSTASVIVAPQVAKIYKEKNASGTSWGMVFLNIVSASVLLAFVTSASRVVDAPMLDTVLGSLTIAFASLRVGVATSLSGMKIYYENGYLNSRINSLNDLIDSFYKNKKPIYTSPNANNQDVESGNATNPLNENTRNPKSLISEVRNDVINKKKKNAASLNQKSLENLMEIYCKLDQESPTGKKKKKIKEKILSIILELFISGKHYTNSAIEINELSRCMKEIKNLQGANETFNQFKVDFKQIENFDKILNDLEEYKKAKNMRSGGLIGAGHKFIKDIIPFCFGAEEQKLHEELSKNAMNANKTKKEFEKDLKEFRNSDNYKNLNENERKIFDKVYNTIFLKDIEGNLKTGDLKIVDIQSLEEFKSNVNQNQNNPNCLVEAINGFLNQIGNIKEQKL